MMSKPLSRSPAALLRDPRIWVLAATLVVYGYLGLLVIGRGWGDGPDGFCGAAFSQNGMNHVKLGWLRTDFAPIWDVGWNGESGRQTYDVHNPFGLSWLIGITYAVFGVSEPSSRAIALAANLLAVVLFFRLAGRLMRPLWQLAATVAFAFAPLFLTDRVFVAPEILCFPAIIGFVDAYVRWVQSGGGRDVRRLALWLVAGTLTEWWFYFAVAGVALHALLGGRWRAALALGGGAVAAFGVFMLHVRFASGSFNGGDSVAGNLWHILLFRLNLSPDSNYGITPSSVYHLAVSSWTSFVPRPMTIGLTLSPLALVVPGCRTTTRSLVLLVMDMLLLFMLVGFCVFSNQFNIHPWYTFSSFTPFLALLFGLGLDATHALARRAGRVAGVVVAMALVALAPWSAVSGHRFDQTQDYKPSTLIEFLRAHPDDLAITFIVHPQAYQFRYCLERRNVRVVRTLAEAEALHRTQGVKYLLVSAANPGPEETSIHEALRARPYQRREVSSLGSRYLAVTLGDGAPCTRGGAPRAVVRSTSSHRSGSCWSASSACSGRSTRRRPSSP